MARCGILYLVGPVAANVRPHSMGKQVNFFMHPGDLAEFDTWLRSRDGTVVLADYSQTSTPRSLPSVTKNVENLRVFLARDSDLANVVTQPITNRGFLIDCLRSPVVEFSRCYFNRDLLRRGRLYYDTGYWDEQKQWQPKPDAFLRWADAIVGRIRRTYKTKHASSYVGATAAKWAKESNGELAHP